MCFSKPNVPSAEEQRAEAQQQETERQNRVRETTGAVNDIFDRRYGPEYFTGIGDAFREHYRPQVEDQFSQARRAIALRYADNAGSSAANRTRAALHGDYARAGQEVEAGAQGAMGDARREVETRRSQLVNLAEAGSSLENTAAQARIAASQNLGRPEYSPIGDLFGRYMSTVGMAARAGDQGYQVPAFFQRQVDFLRGGRGSGSQRVIGG